MGCIIEKWTTFIVVIFLIFGVLPVFTSSTGAEEGDARDAPVLIIEDSIGIKDANESSEGELEPGTYNVTFEFNLTQAVTGVELNVTLTDTNNGSWEQVWNSSLGDLAQGNHVEATGLLDFVNETIYTLNVTIFNETITETNITEVNVSTVKDVFLFDVSIVDEPAESGEYTNETHSIGAAVFNSGNVDVTNGTTVNLTIVDLSDDSVVFQEEMITEVLDYEEFGFVIFNWTPAAEGDYEFNATYNNTEVDDNTSYLYNNNNVSVTVRNTTSYSVELVIVDNEIDEGDFIEAWIIVNNTGNVEHDFQYTVNITKEGEEVIKQPLSTGVLQPHDEHNNTFLEMMNTEGTYTFNLTFDLDGKSLLDTFDVLPVNEPPNLRDQTELPGPIYVGDTLTFSVNYSDADDDAPEFVKLYIGRVWNNSILNFDEEVYNATMTPDNVSDVNYEDGKLYTADWTAELGDDFEYAFVTNDTEDTVAQYPPFTEVDSFDVITPPPTDGDVFGRVSTGTGNNTTYIEGADVVIYKETIEQQNISGNLTNVTVKNFSNTTTDANGNYTLILDLDIKYFIYVNASGYDDSDMSNFTLTEADNEEEINFVLEAWEPTKPEDTTGELGGYVVDATGPVIVGAKIVVETYTWDVEDHHRGNNTNVTVQVPDVEQPNATSDANGSFLIEGIRPGKWNVTITKDGYEPLTVELTFTTALKEKNFTLTAEVLTYKVTGTVTPADATITITGYTPEHNTTSGAYTISGLVNGEYDVTFDKNGYVAQTKTVTINGSDETLTVTLAEEAPKTQDITFGPYDVSFEGWTLEFVLNNETYSGEVNATGYVTIEMPTGSDVPEGHAMVLTKGDEKVEFKEGEEPKLPGAEEDKDNTWVIILIIVIVVVIIAVIIVLLTRKKPEVPSLEELEEEEFEEDIGEDFEEDFEDLEEDELGEFEEFEPEPVPEELEGVEDYEEELEEFEDEFEEGFEDEEFGDYEEEFEDEFDDEFEEDIGLDEDFDEFDDEFDEEFEDF